MVRFGNAEYLWALAAMPLLVLVFIITTRWKKKALTTLGDMPVVRQLIPEVSFSKPIAKFVLFLLALLFLVVALADPQIGLKSEEVKKSGSDVMLLLDVSNSMMAQDLIPNRLENAKRGISQLIDNMHSDRVGIIVFAGQAYVQLPVTTDYSAAKLFLGTISPAMVPDQGTAIGAAIDMGMRSFDFKDGLNKAMILMTDGENHEDDAVGAAIRASQNNVSIHVVGLGSEEGAPIPIIKNGKQSGFFTDSAGQTVISKMNEPMCRQIASAGNGTYVRATNAGSGLTVIMDQLAGMKKKAYDNHVFKDYEDRFQLFLLPALALLIVELLLSNKRSSVLNRLKLFESEPQ